MITIEQVTKEIARLENNGQEMIEHPFVEELAPWVVKNAYTLYSEYKRCAGDDEEDNAVKGIFYTALFLETPEGQEAAKKHLGLVDYGGDSVVLQKDEVGNNEISFDHLG